MPACAARPSARRRRSTARACIVHTIDAGEHDGGGAASASSPRSPAHRPAGADRSTTPRRTPPRRDRASTAAWRRNPICAAFTRACSPAATGSGTNAGNAAGRSTTWFAHSIHGAAVRPSLVARVVAEAPVAAAGHHRRQPRARRARRQHDRASAPRDVAAAQAQAAGIASGSSSGTRKRAGPLNARPPHREGATASRYGNGDDQPLDGQPPRLARSRRTRRRGPVRSPAGRSPGRRAGRRSRSAETRTSCRRVRRTAPSDQACRRSTTKKNSQATALMAGDGEKRDRLRDRLRHARQPHEDQAAERRRQHRRTACASTAAARVPRRAAARDDPRSDDSVLRGLRVLPLPSPRAAAPRSRSARSRRRGRRERRCSVSSSNGAAKRDRRPAEPRGAALPVVRHASHHASAHAAAATRIRKTTTPW